MSAKILFVDDDAFILEAYRRMLGRSYNVETAIGGAEALALLASEGPFAVVVSDMRMLGMDGVGLLSRVRQMSPQTVRIMLTGADNQEVIQQATGGKIFRFLSKPCSRETLTQAIDDALAQYQANQAPATAAAPTSTLAGAVRMVTEAFSGLR